MESTQRTVGIVVVVAFAIAGLIGGLAWAFTHTGAGSAEQSPPLVAGILSSPHRYYDRRIVLTGPVSTVYDRHAITVGPSIQPGLLVALRSRPAAAPFRPNEQVRVTGFVHRFTIAGWRGWTGSAYAPGILDAYVGEPVVRAASVVQVAG